MSQSKQQEPKPANTASPVSEANGALIEPRDGIEAEAMERLAEESYDADEQVIDIQAEETPVTPVVEILPPEAAGLDPDRLANMAVNRTQISLGLTGISFNRTRMSGASGQSVDDETSAGQAPNSQPPSSQPPSSQTAASKAKTSSATPTSAKSATSAPSSTASKPSSADTSKKATAPASTSSASADGASSNSGSSSSDPTDSAPADSLPASWTSADGDEPDFENVQLFSEFLVGAVTYGVGGLMDRIHFFDDQITKDPAEYDLDKQIDKAEEDIETVFRYWVIGTLLWGERTALTLTYRTFQKSLNIGGFVLRTADRTTDNFLLRPARRPFERINAALHKDAAARIDEGRGVERFGRVLAEQTVNDIISDFIDYLSENPELMDLISESGMGLAGNVMDSGRQIGAVTDTTLENVIRRVFRRPKRQDLPPSPFDGKPQTMYDPVNQIESHEEKIGG